MITLLSLFFGAFLAATLLPFSSEVMLVAAIKAGSFDKWLLVLVATAGKVAGAREALQEALAIHQNLAPDSLPAAAVVLTAREETKATPAMAATGLMIAVLFDMVENLQQCCHGPSGPFLVSASRF